MDNFEYYQALLQSFILCFTVLFRVIVYFSHVFALHAATLFMYTGCMFSTVIYGVIYGVIYCVNLSFYIFSQQL